MTPAGSKPKLPLRPPRRPTGPPTESTRSTCIWYGRVVYIPHVDTAPHPMAPAMVVANVGTGNRFARRPPQMWYLMWNRISQVSLNKLTSSHMMYAKYHLHPRVSLLTLTLALLLPNHHLPNDSDSRFTRDAPLTLYVSQI